MLEKMNKLETKVHTQAISKKNLSKLNPKNGKAWKRYCWTCGCCDHWGKFCPQPAAGHKNDATFKDRMQGSTTGVLGLWWCRGAETGIQRILHNCNYLTNKLCQANSLFVPSDNISNKNTLFKLKADTGASKHFIKNEHKTFLAQIQKLFDGPRAMLPNKNTIKATHKGNLILHNQLSQSSRQAFVYPKLTNESLLSIGQLCDDNCLAIFQNITYMLKKTKKS